MGIDNPQEIFQLKMNDLFHGLEFIYAYIDDILVFKKDTGNIMYRSCNEW